MKSQNTRGSFTKSTRNARAQVVRALACSAVAILAGPIQAANINWTGPTDSTWDLTANWQGGVLPGASDVAVMNVNAGRNVYLNNTVQNVQGLLFNQASAYTIFGGAVGTTTGTGGFILRSIDQTGNAANALSPSVTITTTNGGQDVLTSNVTQNTLQLQGMITAGGLVKTGNGTLRLGTSGTAANGAINGDLVINGGTLQVSAANVSGVNNPMATNGAAAGTVGATGANVVIGASGVTFSTTHSNLGAAGSAVTYDWGRNIIANNNSFTWNADRAAGSATSGVAQMGTITLGNATLTTTGGNGFYQRTDGLILNSGTVTTINTGSLLLVDSLQGDASTKIVKTGTSDLRILANANNATTFAGDFDLNQGWLVFEGNGGGQPVGNAETLITVVNSTTTPTVSMRADAAQTFNGINVVAGNNNFNLDVRNLTSGTNGFTMTGGSVTIGNATMNVTGDRAQARLASFNVMPGSTLTTINVNSATNAAQNLTVDLLTGGGAGSVLRKAGGQTLTLTPSVGTYVGDIDHTGGTLTIQAADGLVPTANVGTITLTNSVGLNLRSDAAVDFNAGIAFGANLKSTTLSIDRLTALGTAKQLRVGAIDLTSSPTLGDRTLTLNTANGFTLAADGLGIRSGNGTFTINADTTIDSLAIAAGSTLVKRGGSNLIVSNSSLAGSAGTLDIRAGTLTGNVTGAFGTGTILVGNPQPTTTGFFTDFSRLNWGAQGAGQAASGPDAIARIGGVIDLNVTPAATDTFEVQAFGRIQGTTAQLQALTVGGNLTLGNNAIVMHDNPSSVVENTVTGLPSDMNLWYGLAANAASVPTIGAGTPWKGISGDNTGARSIQGATGEPTVINIAGGDNDQATVEAYLMSMNDQELNIGPGAVTWASAAGAGNFVTLGIQSVMGTSGLGLVPGGRVLFRNSAAATGLAAAVDRIIVENGALSIMTLDGLGGVPVEVRANGSLDINSLSGVILDGDVKIMNGGVLYLNDNQVLGSATATNEGSILIETGGKLDIGGSTPANIFTGSFDNGQAISFTGTGNTVRFAASNITGNTADTGMDSVVPDLNVKYVIAGGATAATVPGTNLSVSMNTQTAGLTLENGTLANDGTSRAFTGPLRLNNTDLTVAASRNTQLVVTSDITTTGNVQIGSLTPIDGRDKSSNSAATNWAGVQDPFNSPAQVVFTGAFAAQDVNVQNSHLAFANANTAITGNISISGGVLYLDGGGPISGTQGELTTKLKAGTLASQIITGANTRMEMKLDLTSAGTRTDINQAFVIGGDVNPLDNRAFWISRSSGSDTGVNLNNVTLLGGAMFAVQEDTASGTSVDVRASLNLAGNAIAGNSSQNTTVDYINITRDLSLPVFNGTNHVVLQHGRMNNNGWSGFNAANSNVYGNIAAGVQVDIVRGQLLFQAGSSLDGVVRTHTAPAGGDSYVVMTSNGSTSAQFFGNGRVVLGRSGAANGPEDMEIRGTEVASGESPLVEFGGTVQFVDDGVPNVDGILRSQRFNDSTVTARAAIANIEISGGATGQLAPQNGVPLTVTNATFTGNGTIDTTATGVTITNIDAGTNTVTLQGAAAPAITNPITAGNLVINGLNMALSVANVSGGLTVGANPGGTLGSGTAGTPGNVTATGNVGGALTVDRSAASISGSVGGGLNVTAGTVNFTGFDWKSVGGPASLDRASVNVSGIVDFGTNMIESTPMTYGAGLREQRTAGSFDLITPNTSPIVKLGPVMANQTGGWGTNETYTYTGQFYVPDNNGNGTGTFAFAENFDDSVNLVIDGVQHLNNGTWNVPTGTGEITLQVGWHDFEARFGQGSGGAGPNTVATGGWDSTLAFGLDITPGIDASKTAPVRANFVAPVDDGSMNLFRTALQSSLNLSASSMVQAAGMKDVGAVNFNGNASYVRLLADGNVTQSNVDTLAVSGGVTGSSIDIDEATDTLTVSRINVGTAAEALRFDGAGNLTVTGNGNGTGGFVFNSSGVLTVDGSLPGVTTLTAGVLRGKGILGALQVDAAVVSPGASAGILTVGTLLATPSSVFHMEIGSGQTDGSPVAGGQYDQIKVTGDTFEISESMLALSVINPLKTNDVFTLILSTGAGTTQGYFAGYAHGSLISLPNGYEVQISYYDDASTAGFDLDGGNDVSLMVTVPEPGSAALMLGGLGAMLAMRRRRQTA